MDQLWAPWRAQYIAESSAPKEPGSGCFLCDGLSAEDDRANLLVWRRASSVVFLNRYPYNNGHLLIAPVRHCGELLELQGEELHEPIDTLRASIAILGRIMRPAGYNVGLNLGRAAGAGLPGHLHWHVVPRWDGDANFMPVVAGTKVIVESLHAFYDRFRQEVAALAAT